MADRLAPLSTDAGVGAPRRLRGVSGFVEAPSLSPDELSLYYRRLEAGRFVIYCVARSERQAATRFGHEEREMRRERRVIDRLAGCLRFGAAIAILISVPALAAIPGWEEDRRLTRSGASSTTSINFARSVATDEAGRVHVVWVEEDAGGAVPFYKRSIDAGESWGPPIRLGEGAAQAFNPSVAAARGSVYVAWQRNGPGGSQIYFRRSTDGGVHWRPEQQLTEEMAGSPSIATEGATVHVVYGRPLGPDEIDIFHRRSLDGGATWEDEVRISDLAYNSWVPTVAVAGDHVYVAWADTVHAPSPCCDKEEEYFARSSDQGATWSAPVRLTADPPGAPASSWAPSLAADGTSVWIVWFDERSEGWEIYTKRSQDYGVNWSADRRLTFSSGAAVRPSIARHGGELFVAYWDNPPGEAEEIFLLHSPDRGTSWDAPERLTEAPGGSILASIAAGEQGAHVVWTDVRDGNGEVYYKRLPGEAVEVGNGLIAFQRIVGGVPQIFTVRADGTGERQLTFEGANTYPAWSKDGSRLLVTSTRSGVENLWIMAPDGAGQAPVSGGGGDHGFVADWSHDGTRIAFAAVRDSSPQPEIWTMNADGSEPTRLTFAPAGTGGSVHPSFAPGDSAIYYGSGASGSVQVWGMLPNGQGPHQKTNGLGPGYPEANVPEWSRGGILTFWAGFEGQYGEVFTLDLDGGGVLTRLTETEDPLSSDNPAWSPDGSKILFDSNRGGTGVSVYVMDADGSSPRELIPGAFLQTAWQPVIAGEGGGGGGGGDGEPFLCVPSEAVACLNQGRFEIRVTWRDFASHTDSGHVVPYSTADSGLFWFFAEENWELLIKVLDGCGLNQRYWVFAAATTNVAYTLTVTDSENGSSVVYENPLGRSSPAITDTAAFATCP